MRGKSDRKNSVERLERNKGFAGQLETRRDHGNEAKSSRSMALSRFRQLEKYASCSREWWTVGVVCTSSGLGREKTVVPLLPQKSVRMDASRQMS